MTCHIYTDKAGYAAEFRGRIQEDNSGVGHNWRTVSPEDLPYDAMTALADEAGIIHDGAEGRVGDVPYRAITE